MAEQTVPASEARSRFAELLDQAEQGRIAITRHGQKRVFLISVREVEALEETLAVLENDDLMRSLRAGLEDARTGRLHDAREALAQLDAEFRGRE